MSKQKKISLRNRKPPAIRFPGGHVQIVNPRWPIENVWSDILHLKPGAELPSHTHKQTSSLLICLSGSGKVGVNETRTQLRKGICAFIPAGAKHYVKAGRRSALTCLSINQGIIKPGAGTDMTFTNPELAGKWSGFMADCGKIAADFQKKIKSDSKNWGVFALDL